MGALIVFGIIMLLLLVVVIAFFRAVHALFDLICGLGKLFWAVGTLFDRLFVRTVDRYERDAEAQAAADAYIHNPGLRLVVNNREAIDA